MATASTRNALGSSRSGGTSGALEHTATPHAYDIGLLVLRVGLGLTIASHGAQKLFGWFGGAGIKGTGAFFTAAGLGLALGLLTPLAGAAVFGAMVNAIAVDWQGGFLATKGTGWEYPFAIA